MQINHSKDEEPKSHTVGLRVMFSEKALIALLHVILVLGFAHLQFHNSANQEVPAKVLQDQPN